MARKKRRYYYPKNDDYYCIGTGKITKIIELNTEYENHFKSVFSVDVPKVDDERLKTCICWSRYVINVGDLIVFKGRYLDNAFLVKSLNILRKANAVIASDSEASQTSVKQEDVHLANSPTAAQEDINGNFQDTT